MVSRVGFLRSCLILAVLKAVGKRPELREVLIRVVRKGRMSPKMSWRREEGIGAGGGVVRCNKPVDFFRGERGEAGKADIGGCRGREDSSRVERGEGGWGGSAFRGDPGLCESQKVERLEGGVGQNGLRFLDRQLAIPESPSHIKVCVV